MIITVSFVLFFIILAKNISLVYFQQSDPTERENNFFGGAVGLRVHNFGVLKQTLSLGPRLRPPQRL